MVRPSTAKKSSGVAAKASKKGQGPRSLSAQHKAQLARGREEARAVRAYLASIDTAPKRPGRRRTPESVDRQIAKVSEQLRGARGIDKLNLVRQRRELEAAREKLAPADDSRALERDFVRVVRSYSERRGIDYSMWREVGVPAAVLTKARVPRTRVAAAR